MSSMAANNPDLRAQQLVSSYVRAGYAPIDPPVEDGPRRATRHEPLHDVRAEHPRAAGDQHSSATGVHVDGHFPPSAVRCRDAPP